MDAFAEIFEPLRPKVLAIAWRLVGPDDAEDVVMDTFLKAWQALPRFRGKSSLSTWLYRIAHNRALDVIRRQQVRAAESLDMEGREERDAQLSSRIRGPDEVAAHSDCEAYIQHAVRQLPTGQRMVLLMRFVDDMSYAEIAAATGISIGTVMSRLFHARRKLRGLLKTVLEDGL